MNTRLNAIAISVYDKFDEVKILVDIIRENWEKEYFITVCCNHPEGENELGSLSIDSYVQGDPVTFYPGKPRINIRYRVIDCIRKSCQEALKFSPKTIMHLHSDAWPLNEKKYLQLIDEMNNKKAKLALRGFGYGVYPGSSPLGHVDDMFFIADAKHAKKVELFDIRPLALLPHKQSIHGMLNTVFLAKVGLDKIYHYDNHMHMVLWKGKQKIMPFSRGKPVIYDERYGFLHLHKQSFIEDFGAKVQSIYLKQEGLDKGKFIEKFINENYDDPKKVFDYLDNLENKLNFKLKWIGFKPEDFGQEYVSKINFLKKVKSRPVLIIKNLIARLVWPLFKKMSLLLRIPPSYYKDSFTRGGFWPQTIEEYYNKELDKEDFVNASDEYWFDS